MAILKSVYFICFKKISIFHHSVCVFDLPRYYSINVSFHVVKVVCTIVAQLPTKKNAVHCLERKNTKLQGGYSHDETEKHLKMQLFHILKEIENAIDKTSLVAHRTVETKEPCDMMHIKCPTKA